MTTAIARARQEESHRKEQEELALMDEVRALRSRLEAETESFDLVRKECEQAAEELSEATRERQEVEMRLQHHQRLDERLHGELYSAPYYSFQPIDTLS